MPERSSPGIAMFAAQKATATAMTISTTAEATDTMPAEIPPRIVVAGPVSDALAILRTGP
jgi:hypothetical protein